MDNSEYLQLFIEETEEHLQSISDHLLKLENSPADLDTIHEIFRSAHTLKGMAGAMHYENMAHLTHEMESRLDDLRSGRLTVTEQVLDVLFSAQDVLSEQLKRILESGSDDGIETTEVTRRIRSLGSVGADQTTSPVSRAKGAPWGRDVFSSARQAMQSDKFVYDISVEVDKASAMPSVRGFMVKQLCETLGEVLVMDPEDPASDQFQGTLHLVLATEKDASEVLTAAKSISEIAQVEVQSFDLAPAPETRANTSQNAPQVSAPVQSKSVRVDVTRLDLLMNLYSEFLTDKTQLEQLAETRQDKELTEVVQHLSRVGADLQEVIMKIRMVPLETVFNRFPRMIRDLAKSLDKKVDFSVFGAETEIDRVLSDEIADPLIHILRNSMDHGLEHPDARIASGKPEVGTVSVRAYHAGNHVYIEIRDDGAGIRRDKIIAKATSVGLITPDRAALLSDEEVFDFLFHSGFSTADKVTDISGRGVGLDAVKTKIESLSGSVTVQSVVGEGTTFIIRLPLTVSILSAMLVRVGDESFALPVGSIVHMDKFIEQPSMGGQLRKMWDFRGALIPLVHLREVLSVADDAPKDAFIAVLSKGDKLSALVVDEFIGQYEIVLKPLGKYLSGRIHAISGATILGDGQVALIVDPNAFFS